MATQIITTAGGTATADSLSIPIADLTSFGLTGAELTNNALGKARGKWAIFARLQSVLSGTSGLIGLSVPIDPTFAASAVNRNVYGYSLTAQFLADKVNGLLTVVPLPSSGSNNGIGGIAIANIFPNAAKVSASASISGAAILIPTADLTAVDSSISHSGLNVASGQDNRGAIVALFNALVAESDLRTATVSSAFLSRSFGSFNVLTVPPAYTQTTNPISGIDAASVASGSKGLFSQTLTIGVEILSSVTSGTIDVNFVTT